MQRRRSRRAPAPRRGTVVATAQADGGGDGYTLNFESAPIANVAKAVLGDILGASYEIDPRAQGTVTLATGRPISKKDVLFVLESGLRANNLVMIREAPDIASRRSPTARRARRISPAAKARRPDTA